MKSQEHQIIEKSISGATWSVILSGSMTVLMFGTNVLIGRASPELLGFYGIVSILIIIYVALFTGGGCAAVINFLPHEPDRNKIPFLYSYALVCLAPVALVFLVALAFPKILTFLFKEPVSFSLYLFFGAISFVVILQVLGVATLHALMEIKISTFVKAVVAIVSFAGFGILYLLHHPVLAEQGKVAVAWVLLIAYTASFLLGGYYVLHRRDRSWPFRFKFYLPPNFWRFSLFMNLSIFIACMFDRVDQFVVLAIYSLKDLGFYRVPKLLAAQVRLVPMFLESASYPTFCNLIAADNDELLKSSFRKYVLISTLLGCLLILTLILFRRPILALFGSEYAERTELMTIVLVLSMIGFGYYQMAEAVVIAFRKTKWLFFMNLTAIVLQIGIALTLFPSLGTMGIAAGYAASNLVLCTAAIVMSSVLLDRLFVKESLAMIGIALVCIIPSLVWPPAFLVQEIVMAGVIVAVYFLLLFFLGVIRKSDIQTGIEYFRTWSQTKSRSTLY